MLNLKKGCVIIFLLLSQSIFAEMIHDPLPKLNLSTLTEGKVLNNKEFEGHVSLLNVWSSWCGYCQTEHEMLLKIKKTYPSIPIYGLNYKDNPDSAKVWLEKAGNPYTLVGIDSQGDLGDELGIDGTPETLVIDSHGIIRYRYLGPINEVEWENTLLPIIKKINPITTR